MALIDPRKKKKKGTTTWTNRKDLIIQTKEGSGEKVGEHVSRERGTDGTGKPGWKQRLGNTKNRLLGNNKNTTAVSTGKKKRGTRYVGGNFKSRR